MTNGLSSLLVEDRMQERLREAEHGRLARSVSTGAPRRNWRDRVTAALAVAAGAMGTAAGRAAAPRPRPAVERVGEASAPLREPCG